MRAGDCVVIAPGAEHQLVNDGAEPLVLLCCCSPPYSHADTVLTASVRSSVPDRRTLEHGAVGAEARAVARAVPRALGRVEADLAVQVRADRRDGVDDAVLVAVGGDPVAVVLHDAALAGGELLERARVGRREPVAEEVRADADCLLEQARARPRAA